MSGAGEQVGSAVAIPLETLRDRIDQLRQWTEASLERASEWKSLREAHNAYTTYTTLLLLHATGHRPVQDPFCYPWNDGGGLVLIEDKAVTERHQRRLAVLPPTAEAQLRHYRDHLHRLAHRVKKEHPPLSQAIARQRDPAGSTTELPQLFFIGQEGRTESVTEARLRDHLKQPPWPWPLNAGRHLICDALWAEGLPMELVRHQLGQLGYGEWPFGTDSAQSPRTFFDRLAPALERTLKDQGWVALSGLRHPSKAPTLPKAESASSGQRIHRQPLLGPDQRARDRAHRAKTVREVVRRVLSNVEESPTNLSANKVAELTSQTANELATSPHLAARARTLLLRWLRQKRGDQGGAGRQATAPNAALPFEEGWPLALETAQAWQKAFLTYLRNQGRSTEEPSPSTRVAEILVSAALFGGLSSPDRLKQLPTDLRNGCWAFRHFLAVEPNDHPQQVPPPPDYRWLPDALTAALITGWFESNRARGQLPFSDCKRALKELLAQMDIDSRHQDPFQGLARQGAALALHQSPGFARPYWRKGKGSTPLPTSAIWRLFTGSRLEAPSSTVASGITRSDPSPAVPIGPESATLKTARDFIHAIRRAISEVDQLPAKGNKRRRQGQKTELRKRLIALFPTDHPYPPVAVALGEWGIHLTRHGTQTKQDLAFGTIARYLRLLATPLLELGHDRPFFHMDPEDLEALYADAVGYPSRENEQAYLGHRIRQFHMFLERNKGMEPLDWGFLPEGPTTGPADAQILTPAEYNRAYHYLVTDPHADERTRILQTAFLLLGYRLGLRAGEIARLRRHELEIDPHQGLVVAHVGANIYGYTKSASSQRLVPCLEPLPEVETHLLESIRDWADGYPEGERVRTGLFADPTNPAQLPDRTPIVDRVQEAMRTSSGQPGLRFHHLRHTWCNRAFAGLTSDQWVGETSERIADALWPDRPEPHHLRWWLTGTPTYSDRTLASLAQMLGHRTFETTARHYLHLPEVVVQGSAQAAPAKPIPYSVWAYALGLTEATAKQAGKRAPKHRLLPVKQNWPTFVGPPSHQAARGRPLDRLSPRPGPVSPLRPATIDRVLCQALERGVDNERIAGAVEATVDQVASIIEAARNIAEQSGFNGLKPPPPELTGKIPGLPSHLRRASKRVRTLLEEYETAIGNLEAHQRQRGLELWVRKYTPRAETLTFSRLQDLESFLNFAEAVGLVAELALLVAEQAPSSTKAQSEDLASRFGLPVVQRQTGLSLIKFLGEAEESPFAGIGVRRGQAALASKGNLNRLLYIFAVWNHLTSSEGVS